MAVRLRPFGSGSTGLSHFSKICSAGRVLGFCARCLPQAACVALPAQPPGQLMERCAHFLPSLLHEVALGKPAICPSYYWKLVYAVGLPPLPPANHLLFQVLWYKLTPHYFIFCSLSHFEKERDYLIPTASEINPYYGFVPGEEETDFHSQPVLNRYLKVIVQFGYISLAWKP